MNLNLSEKIIIVTGGAKGIGEGISKTLAREGAIPVIVGRSLEDNQKTLDEIISSGDKGFQLVAELTKPYECKKAVEETMKKFGRIDGLVNNAGVNDGVGLESGSYEQFMESLHKKFNSLLFDGAPCFACLDKIKRSDCKHWLQDRRDWSRKYFGLCCIQWWAQCPDPRVGC